MSKTPLDRAGLQKIRDDLQRFMVTSPLQLTHPISRTSPEMDKLLSHSLVYLCEAMSLDQATIFFLDEGKQILLAQLQVQQGSVIAGEEEIALVADSPLDRLLKGTLTHFLLHSPVNHLYLPLRAFGSSFGLLRVENIQRKHRISKSIIPLLQDFSHELATSLRGLEMALAERQQVAYMQALHETSNAIFRSLRMEEMLQAVLQSLIHQMGFDRGKIYLINREGDMLERALTLTQSHRQEMDDPERFPLKRGVHPMVDLILGKNSDERLAKYQRTIVYTPLRTRDENIGALMVDNLLSQQEITPEEVLILQGVASQLAMAIKNARLFQGVEELSITDSLTGLYLLRYFKQRLKEEFYRAERTHSPLSLMILDIDHFKRFNDTYGHQVGDLLLATVADRILTNARKVDLTARYGGDEFVILSPDTSSEEALLLADRLHQAIAKEPIPGPDSMSMNITASIGVATYPTHASNSEELFKRADEALYWIKSHGRNRTRLYMPEKPPNG